MHDIGVHRYRMLTFVSHWMRFNEYWNNLLTTSLNCQIKFCRVSRSETQIMMNLKKKKKKKNKNGKKKSNDAIIWKTEHSENTRGKWAEKLNFQWTHPFLRDDIGVSDVVMGVWQGKFIYMVQHLGSSVSNVLKMPPTSF